MPEERIYVISLRKVKLSPCKKRATRATKLLREFLKRHMKSREIKLGQDVNRKLWERGMKHPPPRVRVRAVKRDDSSVEVSLAE